jgi:DNA polymerase-1
MSDELLLPGWKDRIEAAERATAATSPAPRAHLARCWLAGETHFVQTVDEAEILVQAAYESPVSWIGMDAEFRFLHDSPIVLQRGVEWRDIRSLRPFCLGLAIVSGEQALRFVVDLRRPEIHPPLQAVLDLPVAFACHHAKSELFVLRSLNLREPGLVWDTLLAERALRLGRSPLRARCREADEEGEAARLKRDAEAEENDSLSLDRTADRYGVAAPRAGAKAALQGSFLTKDFDAPLTRAEIEYCADDAQLAAAIRAPQRAACDRAGILEVLDRVIMPWTATAAEIEWTGVRFDRDKCRTLLEGSARARDRIAVELAPHGIENPGSTEQLARFLEAEGLDRHLPRTRTDRPSTRDSVLEDREGWHPAIPLVRRWRKLRQLTSDPAVLGQITGCDGRVHAELVVLGADTGRTQSRRPNLMGLGKAFRPLVRAAEGYGIGEVDLSQIEVGIAAAVFRDQALIADFNAGDVYAGMARRIFAGEVPPEDRNLDCRDFKRKHSELRNRTKPLVLGIIYGKGIASLALDLGISRPEAKALWESFRSLYPALCDRMDRARIDSARRGYAYISGLRRFRSGSGPATPHEMRGLGNAYIQGTAALVFFDAGNRLRRLYRQHGARLIIPVHDAFVFEAPPDRLGEVAELTRSVLIRTVQEWFPELRPRADVNINHPECWNHEGHHDSVERFLEDPALKLGSGRTCTPGSRPPPSARPGGCKTALERRVFPKGRLQPPGPASPAGGPRPRRCAGEEAPTPPVRRFVEAERGRTADTTPPPQPRPHAGAMRRTARPFVKWLGGKTYLLPKIGSILGGFDAAGYTYVEPMVDGGAVMFKFGGSFKGMTINDLNPDLVNLYRVVQSDVDGLIAELGNGSYSLMHKEDAASAANYDRIRRWEPAEPVQQAARTLFQLKTCFNGMMRMNKAGRFNVAMGSYRNPVVCDARALKECSSFLSGVRILGPGDGMRCVALEGGPGSFLFVDPPYHHPAMNGNTGRSSRNGGKFAAYSGNEFGEVEQAGLVRTMLDSGSPFIYTNRATDFIVSLFDGSGATLDRVPLTHSIQPKYTTGVVEEELVAYRL